MNSATMDTNSTDPVYPVLQTTIFTTDTHLDANTAEHWTELQFTWAGKIFKLDIADSDRVFDLKAALHGLTKVPSDRQKILGLVKGKLPPDQSRIGDLGLAPGKKFTLIGTPEGDEIKDPSQLEFLPDVVNDLDVDFTENLAASDRYQHDARNIRKVQEATNNLQVNIIHPLRQGKKLLVLDIDYTILDTKPLTSGSLPPAECARPGLHQFLEAIYPYYDICIWSQTSWIWLETKLVELGMIGANRRYEISFGEAKFHFASRLLDKTCMFTVFTERDNKPWTHSVKALQIIWNHFPQFNASNTIHVDDLSRNFALNPKEGLKISAFKGAHTPEAMADRELMKLGRYMLHIANVEDFTSLSHKHWKNVLKSLPRQ
ncbi:HAD-like domain-containing protein [Crassisporium funariophilum]|nr:HAD-like domain-containing protein [Crassisporium funariophilum]